MMQGTTEIRPEEHPEQSEEIKREIEELRRKDEEEYHQQQLRTKENIQKHINLHGGDLSLLLSHPVPAQIKCVQLANFGTSKNIHTVRCPLPLPVKQEVLIRTFSCGVGVSDLMMRQGMMDNWVRSLKPPFVMGSELAGEVVGLGRDVKDFKLGDRVIAFPERKAWREYAVCRSEVCFKIPDDMNYHDAIALILNGIVAYSLVFELGNLRPNKTVLLHTAPGGLGNMVAQMVHSVPNVRLFKIAANPKEENETESWVHYIDRDADYVSEVRHISPHGVDLVLDCEYEDNFNRDLHLLRPMGRYVLFGTHATVLGERGFFETARSWWGQEKLSPLKLFEENKMIAGFNLRHLMYFHRDRAYIRGAVDKVLEMWRAGTIQPVFDAILGLDDFPEALQRLQEHGQTGKIILDPTMSREEARHQRDYFAQAEKIVTERRKQEAPSKFRMPSPGDLVRDAESPRLIKEEEAVRAAELGQRPRPPKQYTPEEFQRLSPEERQQWQQEIQKWQQLTPEQVQQLTPEERRQWELDQRELKFMEQPIELGGGAGGGPTVTRTVIIPGAQQGLQPTSELAGGVTSQTSPYSVEKVLSEIGTASAAEQLMGEGQPIYKKKEVEVVMPVTEKQVKQITEDLPSQVAGEDKNKPGFIEKLRETFSPHQRNE